MLESVPESLTNQAHSLRVQVYPHPHKLPFSTPETLAYYALLVYCSGATYYRMEGRASNFLEI